MLSGNKLYPEVCDGVRRGYIIVTHFVNIIKNLMFIGPCIIVIVEE